MVKVAEIWRHPIKSHGRESLNEIAVIAYQGLPWDRAWAVVHDASDEDGSRWAACHNFSIGSKAPRLMAIDARFDEASNIITLTHPDLAPLSINPDQDQEAFIAWAAPLIPEDRAQSVRLVRAAERAMTDTDYPSISIGNLASHQEVCQKLGQDLSINRWRGNIWLDGLNPWEEFDWVGKQIRIGTVLFEVKEPVKRCRATTANPTTGIRDADTLKALNSWGHQNFNVYAVALSDGSISLGDTFEVL